MQGSFKAGSVQIKQEQGLGRGKDVEAAIAISGVNATYQA